jgi:hypothetical protein
MDDLAAYLLDIIQNSITARSNLILLSIEEKENLSIIIQDDGIGMSDVVLSQVTSPFYTTRTTRKVGLGLPLVKMLCEQTEGQFHLTSTEGLGTTLKLILNHRHIDMPPWGNLGEMIYTVSIHQDVSEFLFSLTSLHGTFSYRLSEVRRMFQETLATYDVMQGITTWINHEINTIRGITNEIT